MGSFFSLGKSSNDTQENSKDALKKEEELKKVQEVQEENAKLNRDKTNLAREKDKLADQNKTLIETNQNLAAEKTELNNKITGLSTDKENLTKDKAELQKRVKALEQSQQALKNEKAELTNENTKLKNEKNELTNKITGLSTEKDNLTKDKENLTTALSNAKTQAEQTSQKLNELERRHAPCQKLEKLYEVFLEVKDRLNFNFVATTHSPMDLIAYVLSDSKYYVESLYDKASQELSDKSEKLAELFDLLFEYIKDSKFERLKEPSAYDHSCKTLYPEQNTSQKMRRVVLRGYMYDKKIACYTIVDMGS
ncbi:hypothetical protein JT239_01395 [Helicobacter pylori]|nr:hypothetical protein [Helicobacter pylori]